MLPEKKKKDGKKKKKKFCYLQNKPISTLFCDPGKIDFKHFS